MSQTTGPYPLVDGGTVSVAMPGSSPWESVVLSNISPFLLSLNGASGQQWLSPWTENLFASPSSHNPFTITATLPAGTSATEEAGAQLQATWYAPGETPPGAYPTALVANAITAAIAGLNFTAGALDVNVSLIEGVVPVVPSVDIIQVTMMGSGSPVQLPNVTALRGVTLYANPNNVDQIGIGSSAGSQPLPLSPGAWGPGLPITDLDLLWAEGTVGDHLICVVI